MPLHRVVDRHPSCTTSVLLSCSMPPVQVRALLPSHAACLPRLVHAMTASTDILMRA